MTFDDSTKEQLFLDANGEIKPDTAIGIMLAFQKTHPRFPLAGTFFVNREPFAGVGRGAAAAALAERPRLRDREPHEGPHPAQPAQLDGGAAADRPRQQGDHRRDPRRQDRGLRAAARRVADAEEARLARELGRHDYKFSGVFEVGAEPSQSPYSTKFEEHAIPRIRTTPPGAGDPEWGSSWWLDILKQHPERRYVSDGNPDTVSFPKSQSEDLAPRFESDAHPY